MGVMRDRLRKIDYIKYLQCRAEFWMSIREPLLSAAAGRDEGQEFHYKHRRQQGYDVEFFVKQRAEFQSSETKAVDFQREFQTDTLYCRSDIIVTDRETGAVDIYEIKAASSVKDEYYDDIAFQKLTAEKSGIAIRDCFIVTVNSEYVRDGEIDPEQLFTVTPATEEVNARFERTKAAAREALAYLDTEFSFTLIDYAKSKHPRKYQFDCLAVKQYFPDLPKRTVFHIPRIHPPKLLALLEMDIIDISDVPEDFELTPKQRAYMATSFSNDPHIDRDAIAERMASWQYPLHFLDYETFSYAVPQFDGVRPFQQMCFQYSLHTIDAPGAEPRHSAEYLARNDEPNPPLALAAHLKEALSGDVGTVFVWFDDFETGRNTEMADMFPEHREFFEGLNAKTVDLMKVFKERLYVDPNFGGSSSIKKVLPVLCPDLDYNVLGIKEGLTASISWFHAATRRGMDETERQRIFADLLEYCKLDTWAMVRIYNVLKALPDETKAWTHTP